MSPQVAIIGRPNVGKSSLLNLLAGRRVSIVEPTAGVTRDRVVADVKLRRPDGSGPERWCQLVDTGGYGIYGDADPLSSLTRDVERQIDLAVDEASVVLFVLDASAGVTPLDRSIAASLRRRGGDLLRHVVLVANKVDSPGHDQDAVDLLELGLGEPVRVSATTGRGKADLIEAIAGMLDASAGPDPSDAPETGMLLAIVGRRNAGKSTLVNTLAGSQRVIASEIAGTTRDAIDVRFTMDGRTFTAIDTAGVRKRKSIEGDIEYYATHRALRSIRRADVVVLMIDATEKVSQVDKRLGQEIADHFKPCLIAINKWDKVDDRLRPDDYLDYLNRELSGLTYCPIAFISARDNEGVEDAIRTARELHDQAGKRVTTGELNRIFKDMLDERGPSPRLGQQAKIYYVSQIETHPPTIALVVNNPDLFDNRYRRYLLNRLRESTPFQEVPIRLLIRPRKRTDAHADPVAQS